MSKPARKKVKVDTHTHKTAVSEPISFPPANKKLTDALDFLKSKNKQNFSSSDMTNLVSNLPGVIIMKENNNKLKITDCKSGKVIMTHVKHGKKASSINGDYDKDFINNLYNMLEESGVYEYYFPSETNSSTNHHDFETLGDTFDSSDYGG